jgi:prevent-host-death family protein
MKKPLVAAEPVSAYEAKTHLPSLLQRAAAGERFVITRHGKPIAELIPYEEDDRAALERTLARAAAIRARLAGNGVRLSDILQPGETSRALAHAGHRY